MELQRFDSFGYGSFFDRRLILSLSLIPIPMAFNSSLRLPSSSQYYSHFCSVRFKYSKLHNVHSQIDLVTTKKRKCCIKSILNDNRPSINDYGAAKSARLLLEKLFEQAQKLEHQMATGATGESYDGEDAQLAYNLSMLESDLQAALRELIRKEEHLMEVERTVILESTELKHTRKSWSNRRGKLRLLAPSMRSWKRR